MAEWAVLWGGLTIFGIIPGGLILWAYWVGSGIKADTDFDQIGSMDVDQRYKRFKDQ